MGAPKRPNVDGGDTNCQVKKNFSPTPGLTPVSDYPELAVAIRKLHRKHGIPYTPITGMNLAGSEEWTCIDVEERPHTLLLVIELKEADRYRWRDIDADARQLLRDRGMEDTCYVRYYIVREQRVQLIEHPEASMRIADEAVGQMRSHPSTPPGLPELIPNPGPTPPAALATPLPGDEARAERRRIRRAQASARHEYNQARRERERMDSITDEMMPADPMTAQDLFRITEQAYMEGQSITSMSWREAYRASRRGPRHFPPSPWQPTEEDLRRLGRLPASVPPSSLTATWRERSAQFDAFERSRRPVPPLPPAQPLPDHYRPRGPLYDSSLWDREASRLPRMSGLHLEDVEDDYE